MKQKSKQGCPILLALIFSVAMLLPLTKAHPSVKYLPSVAEHVDYAPAVVGHTLHAVPAAVSHQSQTIVHEKRPYLRPIVEHHAPIYKTYTPVIKSYTPHTSVAWPALSSLHTSVHGHGHGYEHGHDHVYGHGLGHEYGHDYGHGYGHDHGHAHAYGHSDLYDGWNSPHLKSLHGGGWSSGWKPSTVYEDWDAWALKK